MLTVKKMIDRVRTNCHDVQKIEYDDVLILDCLNDGVRLLRRIAMSKNPDVLRVSLKGSFSKDVETDGGILDDIIDGTGNASNKVIPQKELVNFVKFDNPVGQLIRVMVDNVPITGISADEISDYDVTGRPKYYYLEGFDTLRFYPAPDRDYSYEIVYVDDMTLLELEGASPFPLTLDDLLVEYCGARISINNEFDVSQEQAIISVFSQQIEDVLNRMVPICVQVSGYWDSGGSRKGRW